MLSGQVSCLCVVQVKEMYNWPNVAQRTVAVYNKLAAAPAVKPQQELLGRLRRYRAIGAWAGLIFCCIVVWLHWFWHLLEWQQPAADVDVAVDWPSMQEVLQQRGDTGSGQDSGGDRRPGQRKQQKRATYQA